MDEVKAAEIVNRRGVPAHKGCNLPIITQGVMLLILQKAEKYIRLVRKIIYGAVFRGFKMF